jgi:hypothetical protein
MPQKTRTPKKNVVGNLGSTEFSSISNKEWNALLNSPKFEFSKWCSKFSAKKSRR